MLVAPFWLLIRNSIVINLAILDKIFGLPFGKGLTLPVTRKIHYGSLYLNIKSKTQGIDQRSAVWKRDALTLILAHIKENETITENNYLELGAASGIVSLFLARWLKQNNINHSITCVEPNIDNIQFIEKTALSNNLKINILPFALGYETKWTNFADEKHRGLVGDVALETSSNSKIIQKPMITIDLLKIFCPKPDFCYVDTFLNEDFIITGLLRDYPDVDSYLIEFDYGPSKLIQKLLQENNYSLKQRKGINYLYSKNNTK